MKRIISLTLTLLLIIGTLSAGVAFAAYEDNDAGLPKILNKVYTSQDGNFKYQLDDNGSAYIYSFTNSKATVCSVPGELNGHKVICIEEKAFSNNTNLASINISKSVADINSNAFLNCTALEKIIDNHYIQIHSKAFNGCKKLKSVVLNKGIAFENAFYNCKSLKRITVASDFKLYDYSAGYYNKSSKVKNFMLKIALDEDDFGLNDNAFDYCKNNNLKSTVILTTKDFSTKLENYEMNSGTETIFRVKGKSLKTWNSSDKSIAKITKGGKLTTLKRGNVKISVKIGKRTYTKTITVQNSPILEPVLINAKNKADLAKTYSIIVKKGQKSATIRILYKAYSIDNVYCKDKSGVAKIVGSTASDKFKVKGLKKGTTSFRIKVNGVKTIKLNVKVK